MKRIRMIRYAGVACICLALGALLAPPLTSQGGTTFATVADNLVSTLGANYTAGSGTMVLSSGYGTTVTTRLSNLGYPAISASHPLRFIVVAASAINANGQISNVSLAATYLATGISGDTLSGVTAEVGSTDQNFSAGATWTVYIASRQAMTLQTAVNTLEGNTVAMTGDGTIFASAVTGSPVTLSSGGTLAPALKTQTANTALMGPTTGSPAAPTFRALTASDVPILGTTNLADVFQQPVKAVSGTNISISSAPATVDGFSLTSGDRILLAAQSTGSQNGFWIFNGAGSALTRPADFASGNTQFCFFGIMTIALNGTTYQGTFWQCTTTGTITIDTTATAWSTVGIGLGSGVIGTLPTTHGGTGQTSVGQNNVFVGPTSGSGAPTFRALVAGDLPVVPISGGGTGQSSQTAAFDALSPNTTSGDLTYYNGTHNVRLPGNSTGTKNFLTQTSSTPAWGTIAAADLPTTGLNITSHYGTITSDTDAATITFDLNASDWHTVTLGGNRTLALTNATVGQQFTIALVQDATGSRTVTWFNTIKWAGGTTPTLTTTNGKADIFTFKCYSTGNYYGFVAGQNF